MPDLTQITEVSSGTVFDVRSIPKGGTSGQLLAKKSSTDGDAKWVNPPSSSGGTWGSITGTMSNQTDLQNALNAKKNSSDCGGIEVRPDYTISTTDLTDGTSVLESGKLYFYYEV